MVHGSLGYARRYTNQDCFKSHEVRCPINSGGTKALFGIRETKDVIIQKNQRKRDDPKDPYILGRAETLFHTWTREGKKTSSLHEK